MIDNPFTPVFGGKPNFFFGREEILSRFERALRDGGSEDRALFITGTRGSGKTALLEQLSLRGRDRGWNTIDLGPENTLRALVRRLAGHDEETRTVDPRVSVSILGSGGSVGGVATSKTKRVDESDLDLLLIDACERSQNGVMVSIDEVQKLAERDISAISNAFQMASRKGCDAILVIAGLPFSHDAIIAYRGCTFMRRAVHEKIGLLSREEVHAAFSSALDDTGIRLSDGVLDTLTDESKGHPYMVQLIGYYLVEHVNARNQAEARNVTDADAEIACSMAQDAYRARALRPMVEELTKGEQAYLRSMALSLDDQRTATSSAVAEGLGKSLKQASPVRDKLLKSGLIVAAGKGQLMFAIPYLADYLMEDRPADSEVDRLRAWQV